MVEKMIGLGNQRLILSQNLGDDFVHSLESGATAHDSETIRAARQRLFDKPNTKLLGYNLKGGEGLKEVQESLYRQMGLPKDSKLDDIKDRMLGRENDYFLVITGLDLISSDNQRALKERLQKGLGIDSVYE